MTDDYVTTFIHCNSGLSFVQTVTTEEQWTLRNSKHREAVGTEEQWTQECGDRNIGHRGTVRTVGTEEQWAQRNSEDSGHRGTVGTEEK